MEGLPAVSNMTVVIEIEPITSYERRKRRKRISPTDSFMYQSKNIGPQRERERERE